MSGCSTFPIDVDGCLTEDPGLRPECAISVDVPEPVYSLSMSVNIIVPAGGSTLGCHDVSNYIVPYLNRVWSPHGIDIWLKSCRLVNSIPGADPSPTFPSESIFNRRFLTDLQAHINVFFVDSPRVPNEWAYTALRGQPYNGESYIVVSRTHSRGLFNLGRLANTLAHEIGHLLGIVDHNTVPNTIMVANATHVHDPYPGDEEVLLPHEVATARLFASRGYVPWVFDPINNQNPPVVIIN